MDVEIRMPDLATAENEVTLVRWLVQAGQPVRLGEPLLEIETDKATMEVECVAAGTLKLIHARPGERVAVGQVIAIVETSAAAAQIVREAAVTTSQTSRRLTEVDVSAPVHRPSDGSRVSFFARNKAARGLGPAGAVRLSATQQAAARRLQESKQTIPHFYLNTSANAERLVVLRDAAARRDPPEQIVWDAFFVRAVAQALKAFDRMRYRFDGDRLVPRSTDAVGVAADVDDMLYVVPVEKPLTLNLEQISEQIMSWVERIRQGDPAAKKLRETSLTITNLGAEGIESFSAIINPPETATLAIGKVAPTVMVQDDQIVVQKRVSLTLSVDHRVVNGKYAARFLSKIVHELEHL
jgi:pyruvate dehydrogenase E2 component (dihydrolipoamide acetyltransferase)